MSAWNDAITNESGGGMWFNQAPGHLLTPNSSPDDYLYRPPVMQHFMTDREDEASGPLMAAILRKKKEFERAPEYLVDGPDNWRGKDRGYGPPEHYMTNKGRILAPGTEQYITGKP